MGQVVGKARLKPAVHPLVNLDQAAVYQLWESFNDVAEGFGINVEELMEIISSLQSTTFAHASKQAVFAAVETVFKALDTDNNNLVDSLETLVTFCLLSGMELREKAKFCFMCYDFDESGEITVDELTLLLKSCATGLCKLSDDIIVPVEAKVEELAHEAFRRTGKSHDIKISCDEFVVHCLNTPEIIAWSEYYDDTTDFNARNKFSANSDTNSGMEGKVNAAARNVYAPNLTLEEVLHEEGQEIVRPPRQHKARDPDAAKVAKPTKEEKELEKLYARPWVETVSMTVPTAAPEAPVGQPDEDTLQLDWVHGYSGVYARNNLLYNAAGEIVYSAAAVGVVYSPDTHEQRFNLDHTDDILCVAMHPDNNILATGERGSPPKIHVWDSGSTALLVTLRGVHSVGVSSLAFSPCGRWLVSVGQDPEHTVALYDWEKRVLVFSARSTREKVLGVCFRWPAKEGSSSGTPPPFVTYGEDHILFWNQYGNNKKKKGLFGKIGAPQSMLSAAAHPKTNHVVSGALSGHLYLWDANRNLRRTLKAHDSGVTSLFFSASGNLLSGGEDGKVRLWSSNFEQGATFDVNGLGSLRPAVSSLCYSDDGAKILVGTRGCEIFEMSAEDGSNLHPGPLIAGHYSDELHGLSVHPHKQEYCTVGDDQTLRIWDIETRRMIRMVKIDTKSRSCCYSPDGSLIAVGFGAWGAGNKASKKDGAFMILNEADLCIVHEARDSKKSISDVRFSGDGTTLALGSHDTCIYLYNVEDFASKGKCKGHHGAVENMDFSEDNQCIQSNSSSRELLFWNATTGEQYKKPSTMRDVEWASQNVPVGYANQALWKVPGALTTLNSERSYSGTVLVGADEAGRLRMFRSPAVSEKQGFHQFRGHSSAVRRLRFVYDDSYLITVGQQDRCVMQWKHEVDNAEELQQQDDTIYTNDPDSEDEADFCDDSSLDRSVGQEKHNNEGETAQPPKAQSSVVGQTHEIEFLDDTDEEEEAGAAARPQEDAEQKEGAGDEEASSLPDRPWTRLAVAPSDPPKEDPTAPEEGLSLEWVHGYNAHESRGSVFYLANGELVYPAASLGVVYSKQGGGVQRFFTDHTDRVAAVALHPEGKLVATAQLGLVPKVIVWNTETMEAVRTLSGFHRRGVTALKFSRDGNSIVTVGLDDEHRIAIYDWQNRIITFQTNGGDKKVLDVDFTPSGSGLVQCGINHVKFHDLIGRNVVTRKGLIGKKGKLQAMYCIGWAGNRAVVGTADGHLYGFEGRLLQQSVKGHEKSVHTLYSCSEGLVSGGKDGWVKVWTTGLEIKAQFEVRNCANSIRSVCWDPDSNKIAVGTRACEILEISASDGQDQNNEQPLVCGHSKHELWGLAMHPTKQEYCTVGDDHTVRIWDVATRKVLRSQKLDTAGRAVAYSPDGSRIAVGLGAKIGRGRQKKDGSFVILNEKDLVMVHEGRNSKQWITDIKFSPDGATLACGSYDNSVYLYDIGGGYAVKGVFEGPNSFITHVDVSVDGQFVQTNCGAYELMYCDANSGTNIPAISTLKDVPWSTWTCPLGWPVKGLHGDPGTGAADITACHRSGSGKLVAATDEYGRVQLARYPCLEKTAGRKTYRGHTGAVRNVRFVANDGHAISVGGEDRCIMQWRVDFAEEEVAVRAGNSGRDSDVVFEAKASSKEGLKGTGKGEFVAVRPWIGAVVPPTGAPSGTVQGLEPPTEMDVELEFVYGHRSEDVRNNLRYNCLGQVVYFAASVGIIYDKATHTQQFYLGHDGRPIISLAMHPSGKYVATGEGTAKNRERKGGLVRVHIWNALTGAPVAKLPAVHANAASQLAFSADGSRLISVGEDENHQIFVWRSDSGTWSDTCLQATATAGQEKVLFALFYSSQQLATGGVNHMTFWSLQGRVLTPKRGIFGRKGKIQPLLCACAVGVAQGADPSATSMAKVVTGTVSGHLYVWSGGEIVKSVKAHERTVNSMEVCHEGIVTGSKDGVLKLWDTRLSPIRTFDMSEALPVPHRPAIRSVAWSSERGVVLVGTQGSEIYEITTNNQSILLVTQGHAMDELHGLSCHPTKPNIFVTAGDDQTVRLWDASKRQMVCESNMGCMTRAVCFSPDGTYLGCGLGGSVGRGRQKKDGVLMVLNSETLDLVAEKRDSKEWIADAKYSPDGETLAIASCDNKIYLYDVAKNYELRAKCEGHNSFVTHFDFSDDSEYVRSTCGGYELLYHKNEDGSVINSPSMLKDVKWATTTCPLGFSVQGMWPEVTDETSYNACDVAESLEVIASGDDMGYLNFFYYPAITKGAVPLRKRAHVAAVQNVRFNADQSYVFTVGGPDRVICQWKVTKRASASESNEAQGEATEETKK